MATVTIDGLTFRSDVEDGLVYTRLQGWYSSPPMRGSSDERANADGAFGLIRAYRSARPITFQGALYSNTSAAAIELWAEFASVQSSGAPIVFTVSDDFGTLSSIVSVDGVVQIDDLTPSVATVTARFVAYDPVKYSEPVVAVASVPSAGGGLQYNLHNAGVLEYGAAGELGRVIVTNSGTATTYPFITVTGGLAGGFTISRLDTGQRVQYERVVPEGTIVTLDFRTGSVLVDGVSDASAYVTIADFFGVEPGSEPELQFTPIGSVSGSPTMTVELSSGWW